MEMKWPRVWEDEVENGDQIWPLPWLVVLLGIVDENGAEPVTICGAGQPTMEEDKM